MTRFEERHRELRERETSAPHMARRVVDIDLANFDYRTGPLVDDLVAAARRWDDHLPGCGMWRHEVEHLGQLLICSGKDTLLVDEECTCGYDEFMAKLAALDEASGG